MSATQVRTLPFATGIRVARVLVIAVASFLCVFVALFSYRYLLGTSDVPPFIAINLFRNPWLIIHVAGAATALLVGPLQFSSALRSRVPMVHRLLGRVYVVSCLLGGAAAFVLAFGTSTGWISTAGFASLAVGWIITTSLAWRRAMQGQFIDHRAWMIRSFALTFAAVTLRLYLPLLPLFSIPFIQGYRAISFLCWVPNLLAVELYLHHRRSVF
ncbi:MAG TPA: DUF2306 domain-containing protein [Pyrinomonadaceae bacterium]|nr:DUF2306 domain-containing protein [Pyrinomonadaceae bacterium]